MLVELLNRAAALIVSPKEFWGELSLNKEESAEPILVRFFYPLLGFLAIALFFATFDWELSSLQETLKSLSVLIVTYFLGLYIARFLTGEILGRFFHIDLSKSASMWMTAPLMGYLMMVQIFLTVLPTFSFLSLISLYVIRIAWFIPAAYLKKELTERNQLLVVLIISGVAMISPRIIQNVMHILMPNI